MNFLEKIGFIEKREEEFEGVPELYEELEEPIETETPENITDSIIGDIYRENNISDRERSIYKVKAFIDTLPKEMPLEAKKTTVLGILAASGITVLEVTEDASNRKQILESVLGDIEEKSNQLIAESEREISELEAKIDELNSRIYESKAECSAAKQKIDEEESVINELLTFIEGEDK